MRCTSCCAARVRLCPTRPERAPAPRSWRPAISFGIDAGAGSAQRLAETRLPLQDIDAILLTHLHSDHIGDLGNIALQGWLNGRKAPLDVYGPAGTDDVVAGYAQVFKADEGYRVRHHGAAYLPPAGDVVTAHIVTVRSAADTVPVYARDGLVIKAFLVDHRPVAPAFGYRVEFGGRVVVISGDTRPTASVAREAAHADVLIHEALSPRLVLLLAAQLDTAGDHRRAKMMRDTIGYHTNPVDAAKIAQAAHVRLLVFSHVVPPLPNALLRHMFLQGVDAAAGDVPTMIGHDGTMLTLAPGNTEITRGSLI